MLLEYLNTFIQVCELGSYSKVARKLRITEGGVSHHIAAVENLFGSRLLSRARSGSQLTSEGKIALETAREIFGMLERARSNILDSQKIPHGTVKVEASTIPGEHVLPGIVGEFLQAYPQLDCVVIKVSDSRTAFEKLLDGAADIAATGTLQLDGLGADFERLPIATERLVVIVPKTHYLAKRRAVSLAELKACPFVGRAEGSGTRIETEELLRRAGLSSSDLNIRMQLGSTQSVINAVSRGGGVSILSGIASMKAEKAGLVNALQIADFRAVRRFYLIHSRKRPLSPAAELFWGFCRARRLRGRALLRLQPDT